jgi:predicted HTH domain antitoxin
MYPEAKRWRIDMTHTLQIEIDDELLVALNKSPEEMASDIRLAAAVKWYELGAISQEKAAQMAGLPRSSFIGALSRFEVSPFQETAADIVQSVREL